MPRLAKVRKSSNVIDRLFALIILIGAGSFVPVYAETPYIPCEQQLSAPLQVHSSGWAREPQQTRTYNAQQTGGLTARDLENMELAWAFVFEDTVQPRSLPAITDQAVFIGSEEGAVYALDTQSGCGYWRYQPPRDVSNPMFTQVRTAISVGRVKGKWMAFFGDNTATVYGLDALTGELVWKRKLDPEPFSVITGSQVIYGDKLFATVASWGAGQALNPWGKCCKFSGSLASLDAATGELNWQSRTIKEKAKAVSRNMFGGQRFGPSGAGIWSSPTIDTKRQRVYVGTGQNYTSPASDTSDSIMAFDLNSGEVLWSKQVLPEDAWNVGCEIALFRFNCPDEDGQDYDFGAPPMLVTRSDGVDVIIGATKGGMAYAFDPDNNGEILWQVTLGRGGALGGVHWGMAATPNHVYAAVADTVGKWLDNVPPGEARPGLNKLDIYSGETIWHSSTKDICEGKEDCRNGISAALTGIPGAVFAPALDGVLRAYSMQGGEVIWQFDSTAEVKGVNGIKGHGGTMDAGGVVAANGMLFFNSGYGGYISDGSTDGNVFYVLKKSK